PRPTLFPYTTLFRSREHGEPVDLVLELGDAPGQAPGEGRDLRGPPRVAELRVEHHRVRREELGHRRVARVDPAEVVDGDLLAARSEEHTSELQSREN